MNLRIAGIGAEILIWDLPNTTQECQSLGHDVGCCVKWIRLARDIVLAFLNLRF
jgi:hypothetical protein